MDRTLRAASAVAETTLVLIATSALVFAFTLPLVPQHVTYELPLIRDGGFTGKRADPGDVAKALEQAALATHVDRIDVGGREHLVLTSPLTGAEVEQRSSEVLSQSGYLPQAPRQTVMPNFDDLATESPWRLAVMLSIQNGLFLLAGILFVRFRVAPRADPLVSRRPRAVLLGFAGGAVALALSALISIGLQAIGLPVEEQDWVLQILGQRDVLLRVAPWFVVLGPIAEEWIFRGYVQSRVRQEAGVPAGVLVAAVMFAVIHWNPSGFPIYLTIGATLGWVYERSGTLLAPIVGHITFNAWHVGTALFKTGP